MKCNKCWSELEPKARSVASACGHLFCESLTLLDQYCYAFSAECHTSSLADDGKAEQNLLNSRDTLSLCSAMSAEIEISAGLSCAEEIIGAVRGGSCPLCEAIISKRSGIWTNYFGESFILSSPS